MARYVHQVADVATAINRRGGWQYTNTREIAIDTNLPMRVVSRHIRTLLNTVYHDAWEKLELRRKEWQKAMKSGDRAYIDSTWAAYEQAHTRFQAAAKALADHTP